MNHQFQHPDVFYVGEPANEKEGEMTFVGIDEYPARQLCRLKTYDRTTNY